MTRQTVAQMCKEVAMAWQDIADKLERDWGDIPDQQEITDVSNDADVATKAICALWNRRSA